MYKKQTSFGRQARLQWSVLGSCQFWKTGEVAVVSFGRQGGCSDQFWVLFSFGRQARLQWFFAVCKFWKFGSLVLERLVNRDSIVRSDVFQMQSFSEN
ncbi:MAG: hypothetical protein GY928_25260 [Colwellia sp.]|nr:hypothetical protein [Colwellia sp.]